MQRWQRCNSENRAELAPAMSSAGSVDIVNAATFFVGILGGIRKKCYLCIWILKEAKKCLYINKVYEAYKNHGDAQL